MQINRDWEFMPLGYTQRFVKSEMENEREKEKLQKNIKRLWESHGHKNIPYISYK